MTTIIDHWNRASSTATSSSWYGELKVRRGSNPKYDEVVKDIEENFDKELFERFEETIYNHRVKKDKEEIAKTKHMFDPDNLDIEGNQ